MVMFNLLTPLAKHYTTKATIMYRLLRIQGNGI